MPPRTSVRLSAKSPEHRRLRDALDAEHPGSSDQFRAVEAEGTNPHQYPSRSGLRDRTLLDLQHLGPTRLVNDRCPHPAFPGAGSAAAVHQVREIQRKRLGIGRQTLATDPGTEGRRFALAGGVTIREARIPVLAPSVYSIIVCTRNSRERFSPPLQREVDGAQIVRAEIFGRVGPYVRDLAQDRKRGARLARGGQGEQHVFLGPT
jgi:hypothetical protein